MSARTSLVLASAIYFKAAWQHTFEAGATRDEPFSRASGESVPVPMMREVAEYAFAHADGVRILGMPYLDGRNDMIVFLPDRTDGLGNLERELRTRMKSWLGALHRREVDVSCPRFRVRRSVDLVDELRALGLKSVFDITRAELTGMSPRRQVISAAAHESYIDVNETGTEAAGVTANSMSLGIDPEHPLPEIFRADHPFVFIIRNRETGAILFIGRVVDPSLGSP